MTSPIPTGAIDAARDAAKAHLRIAGAGEDALIAAQAGAALAACEAFANQPLIARDVAQTIPASPEWRRLTCAPVQAIEGVLGLPAEGAAFDLPVDAYAIDIDANGDGWVRIAQPGAAGRAIVSYRAGIAEEWGDTPEPIRQGVVRLIAHFFTHRDAGDAVGLPAAVSALWRPWRRMRL